jgi:phage/plasmid-like protein (TIGR03299 family)
MSAAVETMAFRGEVPWHGLGNKVTNKMSVKQFQKVAGCDWDVYVDHLYLKDPKTGKFVMDDFKVLRRNDTHKVLTRISEDWNPVLNKEAFDFFHEWVKEGKMELETAGSLHDGKVIWCLAKTNQGFETVKGDATDGYLLFVTPHQYGQATTVRNTAIRVVCQNTLNLALGQKSDMRVSITHRQKFDAEEVKMALAANQMKLDKYKEKTKFLAKSKYKMENVAEFAAQIFPRTANENDERKDLPSRNARLIMELLETQPGHEFARGTWWQAFNAVTFSIDHLLGRSRESALVSSWFGVNRQRKLTALDKAVEFAKAA